MAPLVQLQGCTGQTASLLEEKGLGIHLGCSRGVNVRSGANCPQGGAARRVGQRVAQVVGCDSCKDPRSLDKSQVEKMTFKCLSRVLG